MSLAHEITTAIKILNVSTMSQGFFMLPLQSILLHTPVPKQPLISFYHSRLVYLCILGLNSFPQHNDSLGSSMVSQASVFASFY